MTCAHATLCKGCRKYKCADDQIHHCFSCFQCLNICDECSGLEVDAWVYLCRTCFYECKSIEVCFNNSKILPKKCCKCNRFKRIMQHPKPFIHSVWKDDLVCRACAFKSRNTISQKKSRKNIFTEEDIRFEAYIIWKETGCEDSVANWIAAKRKLRQKVL